MVDYLGVALGGILALGGSALTWWLKERADRGRELRADLRSLRDVQIGRTRDAYRTVLLAGRALQEVITRQGLQSTPLNDLPPDQLRTLINEIGGVATRDLRQAEVELWLCGEDTSMLHRLTGAYATYQLSIALPGVVNSETANRELQSLNASLEALRDHARKRLQELSMPL